jgi:hypothetical protein
LKIALCINGVYRPWVNPKPPSLLKAMKDVLSPTDVFLHTWTEHRDSNPYDTLHCPEPVLDYHPVDDIEGLCDHDKFISYRKNRTMHKKTANRNKQLLGYADLLSKIPNNYDLIIRARWETIVSPIFNYNKYIEKAMDVGPVGFMIRPNRNQSIHEDLEVSKGKADDWYQFLPDALIFHRREHYDVEYVYELHEKKKLLPAEWGWYQIMSEPFGNIHTSVHGGADVAR